MKVEKLTEQILLFKCENFKELTMTFCRVQEFYEGMDAFRGKSFDMFDFLWENVSEDGKVAYFYDWAGFNFPSDVYYRWRELNPTLTRKEEEMVRLIEANVIGKKFYIIASRETDTETVDHELAHAFYYLDIDYNMQVDKLLDQLPLPIYEKMVKRLKKMGYADNVVDDEINAYLATSDTKYILKHMKLKPEVIEEHLKTFSKCFGRFKKAKIAPQ